VDYIPMMILSVSDGQEFNLVIASQPFRDRMSCPAIKTKSEGSPSFGLGIEGGRVRLKD
jgi:hypothetical protein